MRRISMATTSQPSFNNAGTFRKSAGAGTTAFNSMPFSNTGTVEVQTGTLSFNDAFNNNGTTRVLSGAGLVLTGGGVSSGNFDVAAGASANLNGGGFAFNPGMTFTGSGFFGVNGGINLTGNSGIANFNLTTNGSISGTFTNSGTMNWSGGTLSATMTIAPGGVLNISGGAQKNFYGTINNQGVVTWSGSGVIAAGSGGAFNNQSGGLFDVQGDATYYYAIVSQPSFNNAGTFRKSAGAGTTAFNSIPFSNTGTVDIQRGTLNFDNGFTQTAAGTLQMEVGGLTPGSVFGRLVVNGQATLAGALNVTLINSFTPQFGDAFSVLTYNSRSGNFASINLPALPNALALTAQYNSANLTLLTVNAGGNNQTNAFQIARASNGLPELRFTGEPNHTYRIQASTNLVDWLDISTNTPSTVCSASLTPMRRA